MNDSGMISTHTPGRVKKSEGRWYVNPGDRVRISEDVRENEVTDGVVLSVRERFGYHNEGMNHTGPVLEVVFDGETKTDTVGEGWVTAVLSRAPAGTTQRPYNKIAELYPLYMAEQVSHPRRGVATGPLEALVMSVLAHVRISIRTGLSSRRAWDLWEKSGKPGMISENFRAYVRWGFMTVPTGPITYTVKYAKFKRWVQHNATKFIEPIAVADDTATRDNMEHERDYWDTVRQDQANDAMDRADKEDAAEDDADLCTCQYNDCGLYGSVDPHDHYESEE